MKIELSILESAAHVLGKDAKYNLSHASMLACDFGKEISNYLPTETVNEFFNLFERAKKREGRN